MVEVNALSLLLLSTYTLNSPPSLPLTTTCQARYLPFSEEAKLLFEGSAWEAGVSRSWAYSPALHKILRRESDGWVGIPNYSIKDKKGRPLAQQPELWEEVHQKIRQGQRPGPRAYSSASGLGQLVADNVDKYYPSGRTGIGDCREEATGMLRYIKAVYGSPNTAWACYGKLRPEQCPWKGFREGY